MFILLTGEHPFDPTGNASGGEMRIAICRGTEYVKGSEAGRKGKSAEGTGAGTESKTETGLESGGESSRSSDATDRHQTRGEGGSMGGGEHGPAAGTSSAT